MSVHKRSNYPIKIGISSFLLEKYILCETDATVRGHFLLRIDGCVPFPSLTCFATVNRDRPSQQEMQREITTARVLYGTVQQHGGGGFSGASFSSADLRFSKAIHLWISLDSCCAAVFHAAAGPASEPLRPLHLKHKHYV